jgi:hypothetical protein
MLQKAQYNASWPMWLFSQKRQMYRCEMKSLPLSAACLSNSPGAVSSLFCRNGRPLLFTQSFVSFSLLVSGGRELVIILARERKEDESS